jgi:hypothetical protein
MQTYVMCQEGRLCQNDYAYSIIITSAIGACKSTHMQWPTIYIDLAKYLQDNGMSMLHVQIVDVEIPVTCM